MSNMHKASYTFRLVPVITAATVVTTAIYAFGSSNSEVLTSAKEIGKAAANYWVTKNPASTDYYADICSFYGCILFGEAIGDSTYLKSIASRYKRTAAIPTGDVDKNSVAILPLYLFTKTRDSSLLRLGKPAADASIKAGGYKRDAIDDTYMTGSLMIQAYRATRDRQYLDFCADYIIYYADKLLQPNGLYWHRIGSKHFWSRGNGWGAASATELLLELPQDHPRYADVLSVFIKHMKGLLAVQRTSGIWMQLLDSNDPKNWEETSGSAMFLFAMFSGMKKGWLDSATFLEPAKKGWKALAGYVKDGKLTNICTGFWGDGTAASYLNAAHNEAGNSHGTAGLLWAAAACVNLFDPFSTAACDFNGRQQACHTPAACGITDGSTVLFDLLGRSIAAGGGSSETIRPARFVIIHRSQATDHKPRIVN